MSLTLSALCSFFLLITGVNSWGKVGHEVIANLAWDRLSNETRTRVSNILDLDDGGDAGSPLAAVANWADHIRITSAYHWSGPLHYIDVQDDEIEGRCKATAPGDLTDCHFEYSRDCINNICVAGAVANYSMRLYQNAPLTSESLKFLTHFVGDIHQPLHSSRKSDRGGNSIHVHFDLKPPHQPYDRDGFSSRSWNLHSIWDDGLIERALIDFYNGEREELEYDLLLLIEDYATSGDLGLFLACGDGRKKICVSIWGEESLEAALAWAYRDVDGEEVVDGSIIADKYYLSRLEVVKRRMVAAGVRLAWTLEQVLEVGNNGLGATVEYIRMK